MIVIRILSCKLLEQNSTDEPPRKRVDP
ncbi:unnamed protein product, partial [Rotaria magnacalcarata]